MPPLVLIDAANVVGSVPDGWWKDREAATVRLRNALEPVAATGLSAAGVPDWARRPPLEVVLVVEGAARGVRSTKGVRVIAADDTADDAIVEQLEAEPDPDRLRLVITADRGLVERVRARGAEVAGPRTVYP